MEFIGKTNSNISVVKQRVEEGFKKFELYTVGKTFRSGIIAKLKQTQDSVGIEFIS